MPESSNIKVPAWIRERFPPNSRAAVDHLRLLIDDEMLLEIAEADYAKDTQHLTALKPLWSGEELVEIDIWYPMEVLELTRWSEPEEEHPQSEANRIRGHKIRAFCCAVLLATPNYEPEKETLIQLLLSVLALGKEATEATTQFLAYRIETLTREEDRPFFALAIGGAIHDLTPSIPLSDEITLTRWISEEEASEREHLTAFASEPWLFGLSFMDMLNKQWRNLIEQIKNERQDLPLGKFLAKHYSPEETSRLNNY